MVSGPRINTYKAHHAHYQAHSRRGNTRLYEKRDVPGHLRLDHVPTLCNPGEWSPVNALPAAACAARAPCFPHAPRGPDHVPDRSPRVRSRGSTVLMGAVASHRYARRCGQSRGQITSITHQCVPQAPERAPKPFRTLDPPAEPA